MPNYKGVFGSVKSEIMMTFKDSAMTVNHGYTENAIDWPWSTDRRFLRENRFLDLLKENLDWFEKTAKMVE